MLLILALVFTFQTAQVETAPVAPLQEQIVRDVRYATTEGVAAKAQSLDIYVPATPGPHPVMVMVHGGGWRLGDKANRAMWKDKAPHFNDEGWVYISINYRLSNGEGVPAHPAHVQDVAKALAWVHDHAMEYRGDPERMFLMGHSSGAHLAALVSTDERRLAAEGKKLSIIKGTVCLDTAGYDIDKYLAEMEPTRTAVALYTNAFGTTRAGWRDASPRHHVAQGKDIPPMLLMHTQGREEVARLSAEMVAALRLADVPATAIHAADKNHSGINACVGQAGDPYTDLIMQFLQEPEEASLLRLYSQAPVHSLRPNGPVRLQFEIESPEDLLIPEAWQLRVEADGERALTIDYPKWTHRSAMLMIAESAAEVRGLDCKYVEDSDYLDVFGNITRITWQCKTVDPPGALRVLANTPPLAPIHELRLDGSARLRLSVENGTPHGQPLSAWRIRLEADGQEVCNLGVPRFTTPNATFAMLQHFVSYAAEADDLKVSAILGPDGAWLDLIGPFTRISWQRIGANRLDTLKLELLELPR